MELTPQLAAEKKLPTHSLRPNFYLRAQIRYILANLDSVKISRVRGKVQDRLWDKVIEYRNSLNSKGFCNWWALAVAAFCTVSFIALAYYFRPKPTFWQFPEDEVRVLSQEPDNPFNYQLQLVHEGVPQIPAMVFHFDPSEPRPQFEVGETLSRLIWEQKGEYQSLGTRAMPYVIERDEKLPGNWPKLAGNCVNLGVKQAVVCDGKPQF